MAHDNTYIVADIGGTNARFAHVSAGNDQLQNIQRFNCADFPFLVDAMQRYIEQAQLNNVNHACLAVAGQVELDWIDLTNNHWAFSRSALARDLSVPITVINDFTAQTLSVDALDQSAFFWVGQPRPVVGRVKVVVGPGTGLGVSAMMPKGEVVPSEAGHIAFAPTDEHQIALLQMLWKRHQRVSVERLLSGMGLANLYWANAQLQGVEKELSAPDISVGADLEDPLCLKAIDDFYHILADVSGDIALMMGADGGLYLSGGILPKIKHFLSVDTFRQRFEDKGRFSEFCSTVPVALILAEHPGLVGCVEALKINDIESEGVEDGVGFLVV